jgi:hypothetical protein
MVFSFEQRYFKLNKCRKSEALKVPKVKYYSKYSRHSGHLIYFYFCNDIQIFNKFPCI